MRWIDAIFARAVQEGVVEGVRMLYPRMSRIERVRVRMLLEMEALLYGPKGFEPLGSIHW